MATLVTTIKENVSLHGQQQGSTRTFTITGINEVAKRVVTCINGQTTTLVTFNTTVYGAAGAVDVNDAKYIRITNLSTSYPLELAIVGAATLYQVSLAAGQSHVLGSPDNLMLAEADTSPSFGTMADIATIQVSPTGANVDVEFFIASV